MNEINAGIFWVRRDLLLMTREISIFKRGRHRLLFIFELKGVKRGIFPISKHVRQVYRVRRVTPFPRSNSNINSSHQSPLVYQLLIFLLHLWSYSSIFSSFSILLSYSFHHLFCNFYPYSSIYFAPIFLLILSIIIPYIKCSTIHPSFVCHLLNSFCNFLLYSSILSILSNDLQQI